jgi:sugar lactone lactonase YvrE
MIAKGRTEHTGPEPNPEFGEKQIGGSGMQTNFWSRLTSSVRLFAVGTWVALFCVLAISLCAASARAQIVVTGPATTLSPLTGGGWFNASPLGGTFVVGANGSVIVGNGYGNTGVFEITQSGVETTLVGGGLSNTESAGIDQYGNVYISSDYQPGVIYKLPYNASTGVYAGFTTAPTTNCLGGTKDAAACVFASGTQSIWGGNTGFTSFFFDGQGNFFFVSDTVPGTDPNSIFECLASSQPACSSSKLIYADTHEIGAVAIDQWGNLFFADGTIGGGTGTVTNLEELPFSGGAYAASPTAQITYTSSASYNGISGVAVNNTGTVFFGVANDGVYALPNVKSGPTPAGIYKVSNEGAKGVTLDAKGNLYVVSGGNNAVMITLGNAGLGASTVGTASATTPTVTVIDNAANCTTPPTLTYTVSESGAASSEFTAATSGLTCASAVTTSSGTFSSPALASTGALYTPKLGFTPTAVGERNATLTIADAANKASSTTALTGVGKGAEGNVDPGVTTAYTTGLTSPDSVVADQAGDLFIADSGAGKVFEIAKGSSTPAAIGTGFVNPDALAFDANGDLFIADNGVPAVDEILNTGTTGAFTAGTQSTVISATTEIGGSALASPMGLAVGPDGTLYIADSGNARVVTYNPINGQAGLTAAIKANGLDAPVGVAVDASGNLYVADSTLNQVVAFWAVGGLTAITPPNVTQIDGVAVDASGSVLVADNGTGNIVRIPNLSGTLTPASAITIETVSPPASSLSMDWLGDLYVASSGNKAAYAIQRTAASINLGTIENTLTGTGTVYLMSSGNTPATLGTPDLTQPTNTMFTLAAASSNGCTSGTAGPPGASCQFTATFAPPSGTANGLQTGVGSIDIATPAVTFSVNLSGTASQTAILPQTISGFNPPTTLDAGQQVTLSATGGASGNPVTFSIDPASACPACVTLVGNKVTAVSAGSVRIDANQAGGTVGGNQYAAAEQVQVVITVKTLSVPGGPGAGILTSQLTWLGAYPTGGDLNGGTAGGDSFGISSAGNIFISTTYGGTVIEVNGQTGAVTTLGSYGQYGNTGGIAVDNNDNLYAGGLYGAGSNIIAKIPYLGNGVYAPLTDATQGTPPANCKGNDTTECVLGPMTTIAGGFGVASMKFDAQGDFFLATTDQGNPHSIWECTAACLAGGTGAPAPVMLFQEPTGASPTTTGQLYLGGLAVDVSGNLFFTDSNEIAPANNQDESSYSDVYELPYTAGTGYAKTPTLLQTFTNTTPGSYDDEIDGVAVDPSGNVYYTEQYEGIFAFPNVSGAIDTAGGYAVSTQGGKGLSYDLKGNIYVTSYSKAVNTSGAETVARIGVDNVAMGVSPIDVETSETNVTAMDNFISCSTPATIGITSSSTQFSATAGTTCSSDTNSDGTGTALHPFAGSNYPATVNFTPSSAGPQSATLTLSDTTNGGQGKTAVTGTGQETAQTIAFTAPTTTTYTYAPGMTITLTASNGGSNNPVTFTADSTSTGAGTISSTTVTGTSSSATLTVTQAGKIVIDANELGGLVSGVYYSAATQVQLTITVNQASQAIIFTAPASPVTYSPTLTVSLSATGGASGNAVTFTVDGSSTGAGTVSGSTLTVTQAGTIVIDANQAGNADYTAAPQVQQSVVVNQASQAITFTPPSQKTYFILGGIQLTINATGGASGNAVVFTVDKSSTAAATITGNVATITSQGNLVIDANQTGNSNYTAAPQATETIAILSPLPTQTIKFNNPGTQVVGTPLTLTATATSGFAVAFASTSTSVCTVSGTKVTFLVSGTCSITATQPGDNATFAAAPPVSQSFLVNATGVAPGLTITFGEALLSIVPGTVGMETITIGSGNNFAGPVTFACSGLPSGYTCTFNPNPVNVQAGAASSTTLSVSGGTAAAVVHSSSRPLLPMAALAAVVCLFGFRKRNRLQLLLLLVVAFVGLGLMSGCNPNNNNENANGTGTKTTVTVTATATGLSGASASIAGSGTFTVDVQ